MPEVPGIRSTSPISALIGIQDWRHYLSDGASFLKTAVNAAEKRPGVFTPEILYNLVAMAIEKLLMGFLMYHGDLAENHTMADLLRSVEHHVLMDKELAADLLLLDSFQEICSLDTFSRKTPTAADISKIIGIGREVQLFVAGRFALENEQRAASLLEHGIP